MTMDMCNSFCLLDYVRNTLSTLCILETLVIELHLKLDVDVAYISKLRFSCLTAMRLR